MGIKQITPEEAKAKLEAEGAVYLDVRSETEFVGGHVPGAINIPLMHLDPSTRQMTPNPDFLRVARAVLPADRKIVVGCMTGMRSQRAAEVLMKAGYSDLSNMRGGFGGARDPMGRLLEPGWSQHDFPVADDNGEGTSYASLRRSAG